MKKRTPVSFRAFYLQWAKLKGWTVPAFHWRIVDFLARAGRRKVMKCFRGGSKSTILAVYQAWKLRENYKWRLLDRGADDDLALKLSSDTKNVLEMHPLCRGMLPGRAGVEQFWVHGNDDKRNASVTAYGIMSNATGSRADEVINDDAEVKKNVETPDLRRKLRERLSEEAHILIPGGCILYVGTDHTHNSIYDEKIADGYESLIIPLFDRVKRIEISDGDGTIPFDFSVTEDELYVIVGIHRYAKVLEPWEYSLTLHAHGGVVRLHRPPADGTPVDVCAGNPWPERFNRSEVEFKRRECITLNAWDSQYLLKARPIHLVRLDPDRLKVYEDEPEIRVANGACEMTLRGRRMVSCRAYWDCSLGKPDSDDSIFSVMFQDSEGHYYWHIMDLLVGADAEGDQGPTIANRVIEYNLPSVTIETNGPGGFLPAMLKKVFKKRGLDCPILEAHVSDNKVKRILDAFEAPMSSGYLFVHRRVIEAGLPDQMRDWIPTKAAQPDDMLDSGAGCIKGQSVKIGRVVQMGQPIARHEWRPNQGSVEVNVEYR